jgi:glycosyltransferase involved in cell wall biosynthesis
MKISIALCTYNGEAYLPMQLASLAWQTWPAHEIVCCDDGSTDNTCILVEEFALTYPGEVRLIRNPVNLGPRKNFEKAISLCTGDYILLCDQDDVWLPAKIEKMVGYLQQHAQMEGVFCNGALMNESGADLEETMWDALYFEAPLRQTTHAGNLLSYLLLNGNVATGTALCFRGTARQYLLPIETLDQLWHDHWIALMLSARKTLGRLDEMLLQYRVHATQQVGFAGRGRSNPEFREAVLQSWLHEAHQGTEQFTVAHFAWALNAFDKFSPLILKHDPSTAGHLQHTAAVLNGNFRSVRKKWFSRFAFFQRKLRLIKHWLKGGEYLRINFGDVITL